jgi:hypothetical protein
VKLPMPCWLVVDITSRIGESCGLFIRDPIHPVDFTDPRWWSNLVRLCLHVMSEAETNWISILVWCFKLTFISWGQPKLSSRVRFPLSVWVIPGSRNEEVLDPLKKAASLSQPTSFPELRQLDEADKSIPSHSRLS